MLAQHIAETREPIRCTLHRPSKLDHRQRRSQIEHSRQQLCRDLSFCAVAGMFRVDKAGGRSQRVFGVDATPLRHFRCGGSTHDRRLGAGQDRGTAGAPVALEDIRVPIFAVGTESDHVAPWRSTYKINLQTETEVTYLLTSGGHNAGIISEPGHPSRSFRVRTKRANDLYADPERYLTEAERYAGSWWPQWTNWLAAHGGAGVAPPRIGAPESGYPPIADAPGTYVLQG
jgi:hypothetical protein